MKKLIVITGPTASGKSALAIETAKALGTGIISADSRQIFYDIPIGTAAPSLEERAVVPHYFVGTHSLDQYFSAWEFEKKALSVIDSEHAGNDYAVMCGGSMLYVNAVVDGLDDLPTISKEVRSKYMKLYEEFGLGYLLEMLRKADPLYYDEVDRNNPKRVIHALEIIDEAGATFSSLRRKNVTPRNFNTLFFAIDWPREELYRRINERVDLMIENGLPEEARKVYPLRKLNSLNTVGYKELFSYFDGTLSLDEAIELIKCNTRAFARKQLTWLRRNPNVHYLTPHEGVNGILEELRK